MKMNPLLMLSLISFSVLAQDMSAKKEKAELLRCHETQASQLKKLSTKILEVAEENHKKALEAQVRLEERSIGQKVLSTLIVPIDMLVEPEDRNTAYGKYIGFMMKYKQAEEIKVKLDEVLVAVNEEIEDDKDNLYQNSELRAIRIKTAFKPIAELARHNLDLKIELKSCQIEGEWVDNFGFREAEGF